MSWRRWKKQPVVGIGIGVGLVGAVALALRYGLKNVTREPIPDAISPAIFATRITQTSKGEMVYHISGSGEPIVFLHGIFLGASSYEWSKIYPWFANDHEVIVPDLVGFGESERTSSSLDASDYAESFQEFLATVCEGRPAIVVASGLTAGIALLLAARHPESLSRLVLLLPTGSKESGRWHAAGLSTLSGLPGINRFVYRNYLARTPFVRTWLSRYAFADATKISEEMVHVIATCAQQYGAEHSIINFLRGRLAFDMESRLSGVAAPVTILWPEKAAGFSPQGGEALSALLPNSRVVSLPDCGVLAALETPEVLAEAIRQALTDALRIEPTA